MNAEEDLTPEELASTGPFIMGLFLILHIVASLASIALAGWLLYAGWKGFSFWWALPVGATAWLVLRFLRGWTIRVVQLTHSRMEAATYDLAEASEAEDASVDIVAQVREEPPVPAFPSAKKIGIAVLLLLLVPAPLWYSLGALAQWLV